MVSFNYSTSILITSKYFLSVLKILVWIIFSPFFSIRVSGKENIERKGPVVFLPRHQRWEDAPLIGMVLPRSAFYITKYEMFQNAFSSFLFRELGAIPLNRKKPMVSRNTFRFIIELLEKKYAIVLFPEGTYYEKQIGPGHLGMIHYIVSRIDVLFIPVGIHYERKGLRYVMHIRFGKGCLKAPKIRSDIFLREMMEEIDRLSQLS